jgi:pSer/pThr/pTyr-binding forkhead associated (FHA) protein
VGRGSCQRPMAAVSRTQTFGEFGSPAGQDDTQFNRIASPRPPAPLGDEGLTVIPVQKVQSIFPSMITVGRTPNNDIVLWDANASKLHAFFRLDPGCFHLVDAGSLNGTWVDERPLAKDVPAPLASGQRVRFAQTEFEFLDAPGCWLWLRTQRVFATGAFPIIKAG